MYQRGSFRYKLFIWIFCVLGLTLVFFPSAGARVDDDALIMTPVLQSHSQDEQVYIYTQGDDRFISFIQFAEIVGLFVGENTPDRITGYMGDPMRRFEIDLSKKQANFDKKMFPISDNDFTIFEDVPLFRLPFLESLFSMKIQPDYLEMVLGIDSAEKLPNTIKYEAQNRRDKAGFFDPKKDKWSDYKFDDRLWSFPVIDFIYQQNVSLPRHSNSNGSKTNSSGFWSVNVANLMAGLDSDFYVFGDASDSPSMRWIGQRTFLEDEPNALNLVNLRVGDIVGIGSSYLINTSNGRGAAASSFKDYVTSADKTITISDTLTDGWEVELYLNEQLIGFRRGTVNGRYEFSSVPVTYGLNVFKLVFYGPFGEIRTEERRYYSGTSPVKNGEFGYVLNAYQPGRYLVESSTDSVSDSDVPVVDFIGYYGLNDHLTMMGGLTHAQDAEDIKKGRSFSMLGAQLLFSGAAFQYNAMMDMDSEKTGHRFEVQGNVYIGDLFARYEYYGDLKSPISFQYGRYLKSLYEARLSGALPVVNSSYFVNFTHADDKHGNSNDTFQARLSRQFFMNYNMTVENTWRSNPGYFVDGHSENEVAILGQMTQGKFGFYTALSTRTNPDFSFKNLNVRADYRWSRYTYVAANYWRNGSTATSSSASSGNILQDKDVFSVTGSHILPVGGISAEVSISTKGNAAVMLRYNISLGKKPNRMEAFSDGRTKLSSQAAVLVRASDEAGKPIPNVFVNVNGAEHPEKTDAKGEVIITDIRPYEKMQFVANMEEVGDAALVPVHELNRYIMRPGAVREVELAFTRKGIIEGQLYKAQRNSEGLLGCKVTAYDRDGKAVATTFSDQEGLFVLEDMCFKNYRLEVLKSGGVIGSFDNVRVDDVVSYFEGEVKSPP